MTETTELRPEEEGAPKKPGSETKSPTWRAGDYNPNRPGAEGPENSNSSSMGCGF